MEIPATSRDSDRLSDWINLVRTLSPLASVGELSECDRRAIGCDLTFASPTSSLDVGTGSTLSLSSHHPILVEQKHLETPALRPGSNRNLKQRETHMPVVRPR